MPEVEIVFSVDNSNEAMVARMDAKAAKLGKRDSFGLKLRLPTFYVRTLYGQRNEKNRLVRSSLLVECLRDFAQLWEDSHYDDLPLTELLIKTTWFKQYHFLLLILYEIAYPIMVYFCIYRIFPLLRLFVNLRSFSILPLFGALFLLYIVTVMTLQVFHLIFDYRYPLPHVWLLLIYQSSALFVGFLIIYNCMAYIVVGLIDRRNIVIATVLLNLFVLFLIGLFGIFFFFPTLKMCLKVIFLYHYIDYYIKLVTIVLLLLVSFQSLRCIKALYNYKYLTVYEHSVRACVWSAADEIGWYYRTYIKFNRQFFKYPMAWQLLLIHDYLEYDYSFTTLDDRWLNLSSDPFEECFDLEKIRLAHSSIIEQCAYLVLQFCHDFIKNIHDGIVRLYYNITAGTLVFQYPTIFQIFHLFSVHPLVETYWEKWDLDDKLGHSAKRDIKVRRHFFYPVELRKNLKAVQPDLMPVYYFDRMPLLDRGIFTVPNRREDLFRNGNEFLLDYIVLRTNRAMMLLFLLTTYYIRYWSNFTRTESMRYYNRYHFLLLVILFLIFVSLYKILVVSIFFYFIPELLISYKVFNYLVCRRNSHALSSWIVFVTFLAGVVHFFIILVFIRGGPAFGFDAKCLYYLVAYFCCLPFIFYRLFYRRNSIFILLKDVVNESFDVQRGWSISLQFFFVLFTVPALFCCLWLLDIPFAYYYGNVAAHAIFDCPLYTQNINFQHKYYRVLNIVPLRLFGLAAFDDKYTVFFYLLVLLIIFLCLTFFCHFYYHSRYANECVFLVHTRIYNAFLHRFLRVTIGHSIYLNRIILLRRENPFKIVEIMPPDKTKIVNPTEVKNFLGSRKRAFLEEPVVISVIRL